MSLNDLDFGAVEESKDFGAVKPTATRLRVREITYKKVEGKDYDGYFSVFNEFVNPETVEAYDPTLVPSAPIDNLYIHNQGSLGFLRRFVESHGGDWGEYTTIDKGGDVIAQINERLQKLVGTEAEAKITIQLKDKDGNELDSPRNRVSYKVVKVA